jgi:hypothetical protein
MGAAAMAVPIPSASTSSKLDLSVTLSAGLLGSVPVSPLETSAQTATAATGLDPLQGMSVHFASADSESSIEPVSTGGDVEARYRISMQHDTLAESLWSGPMGARASAGSSAGFSDVTVRAMPGDTLTLDWSFDELRLESAPLASLATMQHMVSITLDPLAEDGGISRTYSAGFKAIARDGEIHWTAFDFPGSTAISDWLATVLGTDTGLPTVSFDGPTTTLSLASDSLTPSPGPRDLAIELDVTHLEYSIEAPLAPVKPVAELAGSEETGAMTHWDADRQRLSFDRLPLNLLLDARGSASEDADTTDPASNAYIEIDPLVYTGDFDGEGHFIGTGKVRLISQDGETLFEAALSGLAYDERLYALEGFNLFGPLLDPAPLTGSESKWLLAFYARMNGQTFYLPELFIDIGLATEGESPGSRWDSDFSAPASASLSFAGPEVVSLPGSATLILIGLLSLVKTRSARGRTFRSRQSVKGDEVRCTWPQ